MKLELDLQLTSEAAGIPPEADFARWCRAALSGQHEAAELTIRVVDEDEARELNAAWRQRDYATNVLSFIAEVPPGILDIPLLGDLVICAPVVMREAVEQGKTADAHWAHLVIHGCLHLLGHDHVEDDAAEQMEELERQLLAGLGYPDPYVEHTPTELHTP